MIRIINVTLLILTAATLATTGNSARPNTTARDHTIIGHKIAALSVSSRRPNDHTKTPP
jgi:hypothetical protein